MLAVGVALLVLGGTILLDSVVAILRADKPNIEWVLIAAVLVGTGTWLTTKGA